MSTVINQPTFRGITKDMLIKVLTGNRIDKIKPPLSVSLSDRRIDTPMLTRETDYTLTFRYRTSVDEYALYDNPDIEDMIKDQAVKALNDALYGDIREDINKVIDGLFNNHDIYDAANALRKIIDKTMV